LQDGQIKEEEEEILFSIQYGCKKTEFDIDIESIGRVAKKSFN
jgi:hypothetical protein